MTAGRDRNAATMNCRWHTIRRAWSRFGIALALPDIEAIEDEIWEGRAPWICETYFPRQAYAVKLRGVQRVAIFDISLGCIVTLLPSEGWIKRRAA